MEEEPEQLKVATNVWIGYEPLYLARKLNFFDERSISLVESTSASEVIRALRNGAVDAAALTVDEALLLLQSGVDLRILLVFDVSNGADVIMTDKSFTNMNDLKGKRIGVENTALGAYFLTRAIQVSGMKNDFRILPLMVNEHEEAFKKGYIDAVVTFEPVRSKLLSYGAKILFDSSQVPNEIVDVLVVRADFLKKGKKQVKNLVSGWFQALDYLKKHPDIAASYMKGRLKIPENEILKSFEGLRLPEINENIQILTGEKDSLRSTAQKIVAVMLENRLLKNRVNSDTFFDTELISEIIQ